MLYGLFIAQNMDNVKMIFLKYVSGSIAGSVSRCSRCLICRSANTLCNFAVFSVSVRTQIGAVGGAEHTPTTERETGRPIVFPVTDFQRQLLEATFWRVSPFQSCTVIWAAGTYCYRHGWWVIYSCLIVTCWSKDVCVEGFHIFMDIWLVNQSKCNLILS